MVCKPKKYGGLGIVDFQKQNAALLLKFLDKFYNNRDIPWVKLIWHAYYMDKVPHAEQLCGSFWWRDVLKLVYNFRGVAEISIGNGNSFMFWADNWKVDGVSRPIKDRFPRILSFVLDGNMSAAKFYGHENLTDLFHLPLSVQAYAELIELQSLLQSNPVTSEGDSWNFCWDPVYTAAKFYNHIHAHIQVPVVYKWLWKSSYTMRIKCFTWLLLSDRLNTRDLL
jgi:hypothetical protein